MKILTFLLVSFFTLLADNIPSINEYQTDIYFANGIMNNKKDASNSLNILKTELLLNRYNGNRIEMDKHHNFDTAYNTSYGLSEDLFESFLQKTEDDPLLYITWNTFKIWVGTRIKRSDDLLFYFEVVANDAKNADLSLQITNYKNSINAGHGVIVVAHSLSNYYMKGIFDIELFEEDKKLIVVTQEGIVVLNLNDDI